jgi:AcrR family transcriptional regulator
MDAAVKIFARVGFEAASVNEIAQAADVANGTFYLHFADKEEISSVVAHRIAGDIARQLDEAMVDIDDAVERVCFATRQFIDIACSEPEWGWAFFRAAWFMPELRTNSYTYLRGDLQRGAKQGSFNVKIDHFLVDMFGSMVLKALFSRLKGEAGNDAGSRVAELQLRMLGVPASRAKKAAWRKIAPLTLRASNALQRITSEKKGQNNLEKSLGRAGKKRIRPYPMQEHDDD